MIRRSLNSLGVPNYRLYFTGQILSLSGNWMQIVAEAWLVLRLTNSGFALGVASALQFLPILLFGAWGGLLADRVSKRRLLTITQSLMALPALAMWILAASGHATLAVIYALILVRGAVNAVDNPARQSFVVELVGRERVVNAVSLNAVLVQVARIAGPAVAAVVIAAEGVATCFLINALSFLCMLAALRRMDPAKLGRAPLARRGAGALREGFHAVRRTPELRLPLVLMAIVGTLAFNFTTVLPLLARFTYGGGASTFALLFAAMGVGSVVGALANGARGAVSTRLLGKAALLFGAALAGAALAPSIGAALLALALAGAASVTFASGINATLQLSAPPELRGRVMAIYSVVFLGSTPIGGPLVGWICESLGPRAGLAVGAAAALFAGALALVAATGTRLTLRRPAW
ncbi:MAG: MFS transporter [Solirubrobacteraceae bacterium]